MAELSSLWDGLNENLIASFWEVDRKGNRVQGSDVTVKAPLLEGNLEATLNWQSPFEQSGPETKAPTLLAMLQSGTIQPFIDAVASHVGGNAQQQSAEFLKKFEGKTGITKLNSVQVFNGMPPVKMPVTALFRAWRDPVSEVEEPLNQLMKWAMPIHLEQDSSILSRGSEAAQGEKSGIDALLPSQAPTLIAMKYKGRTFAPLCIESIGMPITSPIDASGKFVELSIPMTLATLTAIDRDDWLNFSRS